MASSDKDPQARALAFWIAPGLARDQEARDDLIMKGLSDRNPKVRGLAVEQAMGRVGSLHPQDHIASLILGKLWELTTDPSLEVRVACAQALCNLGLGSPTREDTARLIDLFCALLVEDLTPRDASMEIANLMRLAEVTNDSTTIETIGNRLAALIAQMAKVAGVRAEQLSGHMGPAVAKQEELARLLSPLLPHPEPGVRRLVAAIWAAYLKDLPDALPIIPFLQDNDAGVRCAAIEALGNNDLVKPTVLNVLLHALRNDTPRVKLAILRRIGGTSTRALTPARSSLLPPGLDQPKVVDDLLYVLGDVAPQIAIEAASLLTSVQDPALREKIIETVNARAPENPAALSVLWNLLAPPVGA